MAKRWMYVLILVAMIGMVVAAGSAAAAQGAAAPEAVAAGIASAPNAFSSGPNLAFAVSTRGTDSGPTQVFVVPSGMRIQIDDVLISYGGAVRNDAVMYRGPAGTTVFQYTIFTSSGRFEHSYTNMILNSNEVLKVASLSGGSMTTTWTITGHIIQ